MKTINATTAVCTSTCTSTDNHLFVTTTKEVGIDHPRAVVEIIGADVHLHEEEYIDDVLYEEWCITPKGQSVVIITAHESERLTFIPNWGWREDYYVEGRGWCRR